MTDPTVLADALVEAGILNKEGDSHYWSPQTEIIDGAVRRIDDLLLVPGRDAINTDWRVAGKVLESMNWYDLYKFMDNRTSPGRAQAMNMKKVTPRAIIEAWYAALESKDEPLQAAVTETHKPHCKWHKWDHQYSWHETDCTCAAAGVDDE